MPTSALPPLLLPSYHVLNCCWCWCLVLLALPCPSSGADDAGDAGIWIPCTASTVPPNKDESHHSKATSRGASREKKQFSLHLPAQSRPPSHLVCSVPT